MFGIGSWTRLVGIMLVFGIVQYQSLSAQDAAPRANAEDRANQGTVGVLSSGRSGTDFDILRDLAQILDVEPGLRIVPILGRGSAQNIDDILYLKGADIGIVQEDVLDNIKDSNIYSGISKRITYISKLFDLEFHLVAGPDIHSVEDLAGKQVNFGIPGSGTGFTAKTIFAGLGIAVTPTHFDFVQGIEKVRSGEIAAIALVTGKPDRLIAQLAKGNGLHFIAVDYVRPLRKTYVPALLTHGDYPDLIPVGTRIRTVSVETVMAVYNWSSERSRYRYEKVIRFIDAFMKHYRTLQAPGRHPKWHELNLAAVMPGWTRFVRAQERLKALMKQGESLPRRL